MLVEVGQNLDLVHIIHVVVLIQVFFHALNIQIINQDTIIVIQQEIQSTCSVY